MSDLFDTLREALADRYPIERELGRGGMATVYLARDLKHGRPVAIKVLHADIAAQIGPDRFLREIEIAARLQHPHILPLYDSGEAAGFLYYVMPFVEGESLRDRLTREKQLTQEDVLKITSEVASALGYAHIRDIVHRDIKPENIMLSGGSAIVADFGIARVATAADQQLTQSGTIIGTPAYMSPEQGTGSADLDGRSDQYSLACVVYEMLVGEPPFTGSTAQSIIARHSLAAVSPPSIVRDTIPETMEFALLRGLAKVPADRYPTIIMFAEALAAPSRITAAMRRQTGTMVASGAGLRRWLRRLPWMAAGAVALAGVAWGAVRLIRRTGAAATDAATAADPRHIAVLYFDDRSPDRSLGYLTDGLTEGLIHELSAVSALQVVSRNGVAPYRHLSVGTDSIRRALNVGTIVDGTLTPAGDSLRLTISMVNAATGAEIETAALTVARGHAMALQDTLPGQVAFLLRRHLGQEIEQHATRAETRSERAWELLQQGKEVALGIDTALAAGDTARAARTRGKADSLFAAAASADAAWPAPVIERGWLAWQERHIAGFDKGPADRWTRAGLGFAGDALRLRPDDPEALHLRGTMRYARWFLNLSPAPLTPDGLLAAAEADLRAGSAEANPNRANALALLSQLLAARSQTVDAKLTAMQAYEVDPYQSQAEDVLTRLFLTSLDLEDVAESNKWCREGFRRFPDSPQFTECQIQVYALKGQKPDVPALWRLLERNVAQYPPADREYRRRRGELFVAMALANAGMKDSARAVALRARAGGDIDPTRDLVYVEMLFRSMAGDRDEAIRLLKLYLVTNPQGKANIAADSSWWLRELRTDPEFRQIVGLGK